MGELDQNLENKASQGRRRLLADRQLPVVLVVWALCLLGMFCLLYHCGTPLPWADEWELTAGATGVVPIDWAWLWSPQSEHRAPLPRLEGLVLAVLGHWGFR